MNGVALSTETIRKWNNVILHINAEDHALPSTSQNAPGPCASSYAMGLAYAAMADACAVSLENYDPVLLQLEGKAQPDNLDDFVGGAVSHFLAHVFTNPLHIKTLTEAGWGDPNASDSWKLGETFSTPLRPLWDNQRVSARIKPSEDWYQFKRGDHQQDPLNNRQGFYGQGWAGATAFVDLPAELRVPVQPLGLSQDVLDDAFRLLSPPASDSDTFKTSARDVKAKGIAPEPIEKGPEAEQLTVGTFWAYDGAFGLGTPPRLYIQLVLQVLATRGEDPAAADLARLLARCALAMANSSIVAWRGKYQYAIARPIVWLRGLAPADIVAPEWAPLGSPRSHRQTSPQLFVLAGGVDDQRAVGRTDDPRRFTPNFPAYPSGHATFGGACFSVLRDYLGGEQLHPTGKPVTLISDELDPGTTDPFTTEGRKANPVTFSTITDLMSANLESRVWLGVHWDFDGIDGNAVGVHLGEAAAELYSDIM